uniref:Retrotransposon protein, putative, unclassified n=1 Tax=Oryza sativa subsp. japonica TaxID=39947 RepID=Q2R265_ORYSJ|nr:retrotransposon protein, putative, unclassified [Oryza sativa Japonica Group]
MRAFIADCSVCKQAKSERVRYPGLLQPLLVPEHAWQNVSLDFIEGLPHSSGFDCILVVVDKFRDWFFLKARPYAQHSLTGHTNHKLVFHYFGPFQLRHTSSPSSSDEIQVPVTLPADEEAVPVHVLSRRVYRKGAGAVEQVKVRWQGQTSAEATWEDAAALRLRFPAAPAWGQAVSKGGGNVTDTAPGPATEGNPVKFSKRAERVRRPNVRLFGPEWA